MGITSMARYVLEIDNQSPDFIYTDKDFAEYVYSNGAEGTSVRITANGEAILHIEGKKITVPMFILSELADIKRCLDDSNPFLYGGKTRIYKEEIS